MLFRSANWRVVNRATTLGLLSTLLLCCAVEAQSRGDAESGSQFEIVQRSTVYKHPSSDPYDPANHYGFNHAPSVVRLADGRLLTAWFSGPYEASVNQVILGSYSSDQGDTWSSATVFQDFPHESDFDPAFIADGKRTWFFFSSGRWIRWPFLKDQEHKVGLPSFSLYSRYSDDGGNTWSRPESVEKQLFCRSNGIRLSSGELLLPVYRTVNNEDRSAVLRSTDRGKTWSVSGDIHTPADADEPSIAELKSGDVLMILRTHDGFLWRTVSQDKGKTWAAPQKTSMVAPSSSHNIFRLQDGRLLLANNESPERRTPLTLRASGDNGANWSGPLTLAEAAISTDGAVWDSQVSYPSVAELGDGSVLVVWSEIVLGDAEQYGNIQAARVKLK